MEVDIKQTFVVEATELLQDMESALLRLEGAPDDEETINALFRAAHTIKGSAGIVGVESVEKFTHKVENLMEKVRQGEIGITSDLIGLLLKCRDHITNLVELVASGDDRALSPEMQAAELSLQSRLSLSLESGKKELPPESLAKEEAACKQEEQPAGKRAGTENWHISLRLSRNVLKDGMDPISFISYLSKLGEVVHISTLYEAVPAFDKIDPEEFYLGFEIDFCSSFDKKTIDDVFEFVREDSSIRILPPKSSIESYVRLIRDLPEDPLRLGELLVRGGALTPSELEEALQEQRALAVSGRTEGMEEAKAQTIGEILVKEGMVSAEVVDAAIEKQKKARDVKAQEARTIRVDTNKLDQLVNLVGELVIANANISQQAFRLKDSGLSESASGMSRLVEDIRDKAMQVRMMPINEVFSRFHRVVRDICHSTGKAIELVISGGETEVDKTVVEKISDPLMHLVRNSADHGIEHPETRIARGKPEKGCIRLNAYNDAGSIVIEVSDDGAGLNRERIMKKAVERNLVSHEQTLSDNELFRLIFEPGFSTAEKITNVSGRGVGMDVVRRNIEALRGTVDIESLENSGSTVRIRLPLTLAIIDGFMVGVGGAAYVIPLDMVIECVELSDSDRDSGDRRNYVNLRGEVLPYIRLRDVFGTRNGRARYENIVVVRYAGHKTGLVVDQLFGEVQAVIKSLGRLYRDADGISGATIMGDGTVALILDVPKLVQSAERKR